MLQELLVDSITVWRKNSTVDKFGAATYSKDSIMLPAAWEDDAILVERPGMNAIISKAIVSIGGEEVKVGDYIGLGDIEGTDPTTIDGAFVVVHFQKSKDPEGTEYFNTVFI